MNALRAVDTYALKHRKLSRGHNEQTICGDMMTALGVRGRLECRLPLYHAGAHRSQRDKRPPYMWRAGDVTAVIARGRKPQIKIACMTPPGFYCRSHRVRHYMPKRRA